MVANILETARCATVATTISSCIFKKHWHRWVGTVNTGRADKRDCAVHRSLAVAAIACSLLAACATDDPGPCPLVIRVVDASEVTLYREGPGRDLTDVLYHVAIGPFGSICEYDSDGWIDNELDMSIIVERGPASRDSETSFPYFVVVADAEDRILGKEEFIARIPFENNAVRIGVREKLSQRIFLKSGETGVDYKIYIGLSLTREQLADVRRKKQQFP